LKKFATMLRANEYLLKERSKRKYLRYWLIL